MTKNYKKSCSTTCVLATQTKWGLDANSYRHALAHVVHQEKAYSSADMAKVPASQIHINDLKKIYKVWTAVIRVIEYPTRPE